MSFYVIIFYTDIRTHIYVCECYERPNIVHIYTLYTFIIMFPLSYIYFNISIFG